MPSNASKPPRREVVYWDSGIFIEHLSRNKPDRLRLVDHLIAFARDKKILVVTSALTKAEVLRGPDAESLPEDDRRFLASYFENEWITIRATDSFVWNQTADLRRKFSSFKLPDAVHAATALLSGVKVLETFDRDDLIKKDRLIGNPPLIIRSPIFRDEPTLFDGTQGSKETESKSSDHGQVD